MRSTSRAGAVAKIACDYSVFDDSFLIIGCHDGMLLAAIRESGRRNLTLFESDKKNLERFLSSWPEVYEAVQIGVGEPNELIAQLPTRSYTMIIVDGCVVDPLLVAAASDNIVLVVGRNVDPSYFLSLNKISEFKLTDKESVHCFIIKEAIQ